jgi:tetratricopeptide (TPR) repeat protein
LTRRKDEIKITSQYQTEFNSAVVIGRDKYFVQTENIKAKRSFIVTRIFLSGKILSTRKIDCSDIMDLPNSDVRVQKLMQSQHQSAISMLKAEKSRKVRTPSDYLEEVKTLMRKGNPEKAVSLLRDAIEQYPDNSVLLSYYGCLEAVVNKNYEYGINTCHKAIETLKERMPLGEEFFSPVFYLNLGRAYLAAGKRKDAHDTFQKGIKTDAENSDLLEELKRLGMRRKHTVPFLKRSHPINKYIGMLLQKYSK